jgi:hypothetical protein
MVDAFVLRDAALAQDLVVDDADRRFVAPTVGEGASLAAVACGGLKICPAARGSGGYGANEEQCAKQHGIFSTFLQCKVLVHHRTYDVRCQHESAEKKA